MQANQSKRDSSPSPAGSNYTTASESERQNFSDASNATYELERVQAPIQAMPNENISTVQPKFSDVNSQDGQHGSMPASMSSSIHQPSSTSSSVATLIASNENITPHIATSVPPDHPTDTGKTANGAVPKIVNGMGDFTRAKQEGALASVSGTATPKVSSVQKLHEYGSLFQVRTVITVALIPYQT